jgi:hypothetical protein
MFLRPQKSQIRMQNDKINFRIGTTWPKNFWILLYNIAEYQSSGFVTFFIQDPAINSGLSDPEPSFFANYRIQEICSSATTIIFTLAFKHSHLEVTILYSRN